MPSGSLAFPEDRQVAGREGIEDIRDRLDNIRSVEPLLGAMRTISLGSWQAALRRKGRALSYADRLRDLMPALIPLLGGERRSRGPEPVSPSALALVVGSERGLCGAYNTTLAEYVDGELARLAEAGMEVQLHVLGKRAARALERMGREASETRSLPVAALPSSDMASELTRSWLKQYEARAIDAVYVMYHQYLNSTAYEPVTLQLIPPPLPSYGEGRQSWPPPYIDTAPVDLFVHVIVLWTATEMYRILLDAAASEHATRYRLMEGATQNANNLIDELTLALRAARQEAITAEMQELAVGAGLLGSEEE
jgi:F-type H+-transporting ATPase subunit gamma